MTRDILQPAVVLIAWTLVIWGWMVAVRLPALKAAGIELGRLVGGRGADADRVLPPKAQWPSHNYNHLLDSRRSSMRRRWCWPSRARTTAWASRSPGLM